MSNFPDDIRSYDNDPRSPFFVEPDEPQCHLCLEVMEYDGLDWTCYNPHCETDLDDDADD